MPKVTRRTRTRGGHKTYSCSRCGSPIEPGSEFFVWSRRFGRSGMTYYQHTACGYPRASQLSSRKTAAVEDSISDAQNEIGAWSPGGVEFTPADYVGGGSLTIDVDDLSSIIDGVADEAESVGDEYSEGADAMPESLQNGSQAEAMREVGQELHDWADGARNWASGVTLDIDVPDPADFPAEGDEDDEDYDPDAVDEDAWREACEAVLDSALDEIRDAANNAFDDLPEYQG